MLTKKMSEVWNAPLYALYLFLSSAPATTWTSLSGTSASIFYSHQIRNTNGCPRPNTPNSINRVYERYYCRNENPRADAPFRAWSQG